MKNTFLKNHTLGLTVAAVLATGSFCTTSYAQQKGVTLQVSATVATECDIGTSPINFGVLSSTTVNKAEGVVAVYCNFGTQGSIGLSESGHNDEIGSYHRMGTTNPNDNESIQYKISTDAAGTLPWGTVGSANEQYFTSQGMFINIPVYAETINYLGGLGSGTYIDNVTATVTY